MTDVNESVRALQDCNACGVSDTEPRHHIYDPAAGGTLSFHFACCADNGCDICRGVLNDVSDTPEETG